MKRSRGYVKQIDVMRTVRLRNVKRKFKTVSEQVPTSGNWNRRRKMSKTKGGFTLPGESGYEKLTLKMAEKWGADVIRDSDGTVLSDEIVHAGYGIYSTICIIRDHNEWAKKNPDKLQQTFLCTPAKVAEGDEITIDLMESFFEEQFRINDTEAAFKYWEVYDRTVNEKVDASQWSYGKEIGRAHV